MGQTIEHSSAGRHMFYVFPSTFAVLLSHFVVRDEDLHPNLAFDLAYPGHVTPKVL